MNSKIIYIVRHGETDFNHRGIIQGSGVDSALNNTGKKQAQAFYRHYRQVPFQAVLTSRLQRTHQTVAPFIESGLPWEQFAEINEMNWGRHEGQICTPEMAEEYDTIRARWSSGDYDARIEAGESAAELAERLRRFVNHLRSREEDYLLICSHGRAMSAMMSILKDEELKYMNRYAHANTGLWKTRFADGLFRFEIENNTEHLLSASTDKAGNHSTGHLDVEK